MNNKWDEKLVQVYGTLALNFVEENMDLIESNNFPALFAKNDNHLVTGNIIHILDDSNIDWMSYVTSIPGCAYWCRDDITSITVPDNIYGIGPQAFAQCSHLEELILPATIRDIGGLILEHTYLNKIIFKGTKKQWNNIWFGSGWNKYSRIGEVHCANGIIREAIPK